MITTDEIPLEKMRAMEFSHHCRCGGTLSVAWGGAFGIQGYVLRCGNDPQHRDFERSFEMTMGNCPDIPGWQLTKKRRNQMESQIGSENTSKLMKYQGRITLTEEEVKDIIATIWPRAIKEAPDVVKRAVLICLQYRLNPLVKQLHLLPFLNKKESKRQGYEIYDWAIARGIQADRLLARRQGPFSYIDNTPRRMTEEEQKQIYGKIDKQSFHAIVRLRDPSTGAEVTGYGAWPVNVDVYGIEKGNTMENMAFIHAERQALDRLHPGEMPEDVMVVDERFFNIEKVAPISPTNTKIIDAPPSDKTTTTKSIEEKEPPAAEEQHLLDESLIAGMDKVWIQETIKAIHWSEETTKSWISVNLKVEATGDLYKDVLPRLTKEQAIRFTNEISNKASQLPLVEN